MGTVRRSRRQRQSRGKRIVLTERDLSIFRALSRYRYLRSTYLYAFAGGASETRFKERLGDLFHEGYLDRPAEQWRLAEGLHAPTIYELGRAAARVLEGSELGGDARRVLLGPGAHRQFEHSVMICDVLASIELDALTTPNLRFISVFEILAKAPETTRHAPSPLQLQIGTGKDQSVVPDAVFGLAYLAKEQPCYRFFALEADRGTMPVARNNRGQSSYLSKLRTYISVLAEGQPRRVWGIPRAVQRSKLSL